MLSASLKLASNSGLNPEISSGELLNEMKTLKQEVYICSFTCILYISLGQQFGKELIVVGWQF